LSASQTVYWNYLQWKKLQFVWGKLLTYSYCIGFSKSANVVTNEELPLLGTKASS